MKETKNKAKEKDKKDKRRQSEERDELFMSCQRRGQLWPIDTR